MDGKALLQRSAWLKHGRAKAVQITGIQNLQSTVSAWFPCPKHDRASLSTAMLKAVQITGDDIFTKIRVPRAASKMHRPKHTLNTAMHYSCL